MKTSQTKMLLRWWLLVIIMVISFFITWKMDFLNFLIEKDFTKLSFVILGILIISTLSIGIKIFNDFDYHDYEMEWFAGDAVISIGMIGTVVGFIYMLYSIFMEINFGESSELVQSLKEMSNGMSTALLTTLVGLISSILIKFQLILVKTYRE